MATSKQTKLINVAKLMQKVPSGTWFYSPLLGWFKEHTISEEHDDSAINIVSETDDIYLDIYGRYSRYGDVVVWPSKFRRSWKGFDPEQHVELVKKERKSDDGTPINYGGVTEPDIDGSTIIGGNIVTTTEDAEKVAIRTYDDNDPSPLKDINLNFMEVTL